MKNRIYALLLAFLPLLSFAQSVPFPSGNGRDYNAIEPYGYEDVNTTWDTSPYLPFIYHGIWFRMMLPNGVTWNAQTKTFSNANPSQKYPLILFFHGRGEVGTDNNRQLTHGGEVHKNAVLNGQFPGFLLYPQSVGNEGAKDVLEKLLAQLPVDINRIYVHGLSNGGQESWKFLIANPQLVAAAFPMSAADINARVNNLLYTPLRESQGELDTNPTLGYAQQVKDWFDTNGGHLEMFVLPNTGHSTWNPMYNRPDFFPWFLSHKKNEIMVRYDRNLVCPDAAANVVMGFTPGMQNYEWRKDGVLMSGQTANTITATTFGSYTGRFRYRNVWTDWSDAVVVGQRPATVTPNITVVGSSLYVPDVNGVSAVNLSLPAGYATYRWNKQGETEPVGTTQNVSVSRAGTYTATVTETAGCPTVPSIPSPGVTVIDASGAAPDAPTNLQAAGSSLTSITLTWENNPTPELNETNFEIFRASTSGGPYALVATVPADVLSYVNTGLTQNVWYYYKVRAISASGASPATLEVAGLSQVDSTPPTPPTGVTGTSTGSTATPGIRVSWPANASTDAVGVVAYEIWQKEWPNGNYQKAFNVAPSGSTTNFTISNLPTGIYYTFVVKARDAAGNVSGPSTEVFRNASYAAGGTTGLAYKYYRTTAAAPWTVIPNFDALTPTSTGFMTNFALTGPSPTPADYFGFRYDGAIMIQSPATYTFFLQNNADEGSRLYINGQLVVNNDGQANNTTEKSGTITLQPGFYPIRAEYFERTSTQSFAVRWQAASIGIAKGTIPNANLIRNYADVAGEIPLPAAPGSVVPTSMTAVAASHSAINLNWAYAGTGTQLEIYTSPNNSAWSLVTIVNVGTTTYQHQNLNANTRYYYRMRATNVVGQGSYSSSVNTFTQALPPVPATPTGLVITGVTPSSATLDWLDNATNEASYEIYKSTPDNANYTKLNTLPANTIHHVDNTLFAHTSYYYKVLAKNVTGNSAFSNEVQITTTNTAPVLTAIANQMVRHSDTYSIPLTATDADGDLVIMGSNNMPSFAQVFDYGDGTGEIVLAPTTDNVGTFSNIEVFAEDLYGGRTTRTFNITVNSNHTPVVSDPGAITLRESYKQVLNITATDADTDPITWTIGDLPAFVAAVVNGNSVQVTIQPGLNDSGSFNLSLTAKDPSQASATVVVPVTITNYNPNFSVSVNFRPNTGNDNTLAATPWNNMSLGITNLALNDQTGAASGISAQVQANIWQASNVGIVPGVYIDNVQRGYFYFQMGTANDSRSVTLSGLNPNGKYNVKFLASRTNNDANNRTTKFTIGGVTQQINANGNASTLVEFNALTPAANGTIVVTVAGSLLNGYAVLNAMVVESFYAGTTAPTAPTSLALSTLNQQVKLTWVDNADNENAFEVYRSEDDANYAKIGQTSPDVTTYTDVNLVSGVTYYYKVLAKNGIGSSAYSNTATVVGPNHAPVFGTLATIQVPEDDMKFIQIDAVDADGDVITFDLINAPPFAWQEPIDENSTLITVAPFSGDNGEYTFQLSGMDVHGAVTLATVNVYVGYSDEISVKVNFTQPGVNATAPWNNVSTFSSGTVISGLVNGSNVATTMSLSMTTTNGWITFNNTGYTTNNNSGVYPDNVLRTSVFTQSSSNMLLGGLDPAKTYEFTFFASRDNVADARNTTYSIGLKSAVLNAANNHSNVVKIPGVRPNTSGQITITTTKGESGFGYLGAMLIREYTAPNVPMPPAAPMNLASVVTSRTSVRLNWVDASDDETGFEIWRSVGNNLNYSLVTSVAPNTTTYNNTSLTAATTYYYKVRAINGVGPSAYTNESSSTTYNYSISINFNSAGGYTQTNWNNLGSWNGSDGWVFSSNLTDDTNTGTQITATAIKAFGGQNFAGMQTGNNSGVVPDRVMKQSWYVDKGTTAQIRFANLNLLKKYNFAFFGSRDDTADPTTRITHYIIGSTTVTLDCSKNTQNLAQIYDVVPAADGTITVTVYAPLASAYGYLNAMIIQAVPNPNARIAADDEVAGNTSIFENTEVQAYPNPFSDRLTLKFAKGGHFQAKMLSINGIAAFQGEFDAEDEQEVELPVSADLAPGVYILNVIESQGAAQTIKLLKK